MSNVKLCQSLTVTFNQPIVSKKLAFKAKCTWSRQTHVSCVCLYITLTGKQIPTAFLWLLAYYIILFLSMISEPHPSKFWWYPFLNLIVWPKHPIYQLWCFNHKVNNSPIFTGLTTPLTIAPHHYTTFLSLHTVNNKNSGWHWHCRLF